MAIGTKANFVIYEDEFFEGAYETLAQNIDVFGPASNNCIVLNPDRHRGDFHKRSFFKNVSGGLIARRDPTVTTSVTSAALTMDDRTSPKLARRIGPVEDTIDAFKKISQDASLMSFIIGQQTGPEMFVDHIDTAILAVDAALNGQAAAEHDATDGTITTADLVTGLSKMGDRAGRIRCWVMHSKVFYDLVKEQISANITNIADVNVMEAHPITMGRPVLVVDSASLLLSGTTNVYVTLGLTTDGIVVSESEERTIESDTNLGNENITVQIQGEYSVTVKLKGFDFTGSANPTDANLGSQGNWSFVMDSIKDGPGIRITSL
jgi:hypothetical protein